MTDELKVYGTDWCPKTALLKNFLQAEWIDFKYFNVDTDPIAREELKELYQGKLKFPTVTYKGKHLKNPKIAELRAFVHENNIE